MKRLFTLFILIFSGECMAANDSVSTTRVTHKVGGRIDVNFYMDTRNNNVDTRNGLQYIASGRPIPNKAGKDLAFQPNLRASAAATRLNYCVTATNIWGGSIRGFVEVDFMGVNSSVMNSLRMRHAFVELQWENRSLIFGQTSHLTMVNEVTPNTVTYGGGYPFNPLNRPVQVQFKQRLGRFSDITIAAGIFSGSVGGMQGYALTPDFQVRFMSGDPSKFVYGAGVGIKSIKPRTAINNTVTSDPNGDIVNTKKKLTTFNATVFGHYTFGQGYSLRAYAIWGENLSSLSLLGGYAPLADAYNDVSGVGEFDYGYSAVSVISAFVDFESPVYKGWQFGLFGGWQQNLGSNKDILVAKDRLHVDNYGLHLFWRVAPRVHYHCGKNLSFGLEYAINGAQWMNACDSRYRPDGKTDFGNNHRIICLAQYRF